MAHISVNIAAMYFAANATAGGGGAARCSGVRSEKQKGYSLSWQCARAGSGVQTCGINPFLELVLLYGPPEAHFLINPRS